MNLGDFCKWCNIFVSGYDAMAEVFMKSQKMSFFSFIKRN